MVLLNANGRLVRFTHCYAFLGRLPAAVSGLFPAPQEGLPMDTNRGPPQCDILGESQVNFQNASNACARVL